MKVLKSSKYKCQSIIDEEFFNSSSSWNNMGMILKYNFLAGTARFGLNEVEL